MNSIAVFFYSVNGFQEEMKAIPRQLIRSTKKPRKKSKKGRYSYNKQQLSKKPKEEEGVELEVGWTCHKTLCWQSIVGCFVHVNIKKGLLEFDMQLMMTFNYSDTLEDHFPRYWSCIKSSTFSSTSSILQNILTSDLFY